MGAVNYDGMDKIYIDGGFEAPKNAQAVSVINPATEDPIGVAPQGSAEDADAAIGAARDAFDKGPWPRMTANERAKVLAKFRDELQARRAIFETIQIEEAGCVKQLAGFMIDFPSKHLNFAINMLSQDHSQSFPPEISPNPDGSSSITQSTMERFPVGVVAAISAYNYPYSIYVFKLAAALAMGNTVVLKPSPLTPFTGLALADAVHAAGFPKGVVNIVTGDADVGAKLSSDPRVDLVSFTGSDAVGSKIAAQAAPTLKRLILELGGKSGMIVCEDADLSKAVTAGLISFTMHAGQGCSMTTRHIVHNKIRNAYVEALRSALGSVTIGDPHDPTIAMGPLINSAARDRVENFVERAQSDNASLIAGGQRPDIAKGFFFQPTFFDNVDPNSHLAQQEVFGPIAAVIGYDTDEEAIAIANNSDFGLSGSIYSQNTGRAYEMARQVYTGTMAINFFGGGSPYASMGGVGRSGYGRELGIDGLYAYTYQKHMAYQAA